MMSINYTFLYLSSEGKKLILSEKNPSFNKDLKDTAALYLQLKIWLVKLLRGFPCQLQN